MEGLRHIATAHMLGNVNSAQIFLLESCPLNYSYPDLLAIPSNLKNFF